MNFFLEKKGDVGLLTLKGKLLGPPETDELHKKVKSMLDEKTTSIVIDLRHVTWMGSLGIGALMRCMTTVRNSGGDLRLTGLSDKVRSLFSITKLIGIIKIFDTPNDAILSFEKQ